MAKLMWALTCQRIIVDGDTNLVTYVDSAEEVRVPQVPFAIGFAVGVLWKRDSPGESIRMRLSIHDPNGTLLLQKEGFLNHPVVLRHRANLSVAFMVQSVGSLAVTIEQFADDKWRLETSIPVDVGLVEKQEEPNNPELGD